MPRLPLFSRLRSRSAASICSPRAPCLGYLASHGCARRRSKHLFAEGPVPRLPSFSRLREQTVFAEVPVPRLPLFPRLRSHAASICSPRAPCLGYLASHGCANRRSKHLFAEVPVPRLPSFSRFCLQNPKRTLSSQIAFA